MFHQLLEGYLGETSNERSPPAVSEKVQVSDCGLGILLSTEGKCAAFWRRCYLHTPDKQEYTDRNEQAPARLSHRQPQERRLSRARTDRRGHLERQSTRQMADWQCRHPRRSIRGWKTGSHLQQSVRGVDVANQAHLQQRLPRHALACRGRIKCVASCWQRRCCNALELDTELPPSGPTVESGCGGAGSSSTPCLADCRFPTSAACMTDCITQCPFEHRPAPTRT